MSTYDLYAGDWRHLDQVEDVDFYPLDDASGVPYGPLQGIKARKANESRPGFSGGPVALEGTSRRWLLFSEGMDGATPDPGSYFVQTDGSRWNVLASEAMVYGTRWVVTAERQYPRG